MAEARQRGARPWTLTNGVTARARGRPLRALSLRSLDDNARVMPSGRGRAARPNWVTGLWGCGDASGAGPGCYSTMSFLRVWTNATNSRCSPSGTWNFASVAAA